MTPAILLIIGAAVIGPIEALPPPNACGFTDREILRANKCAEWKPETIPEICARAMKEIGAFEITDADISAGRGFYPGWRWGPRGKDGPWVMTVDCIPAPTGLKR